MTEPRIKLGAEVTHRLIGLVGTVTSAYFPSVYGPTVEVRWADGRLSVAYVDELETLP